MAWLLKNLHAEQGERRQTISVRPNEQNDAREDDITIDASYEPVQPQKADRIDIAQDYCAAVQRVRRKSREKTKDAVK